MGNGSVQRIRSEREFQHGRAGTLAKRARAAEDRRPVLGLMKTRHVLERVGAVGAREPAWISKPG